MLDAYPRNARRAQEAAVALRDVFVLLMIDAPASFDRALTEIVGGVLSGSSSQSMVELRSRCHVTLPAICPLAQCSAAFERAVPQIFRAPLSAQEVADIFVAYRECAQPVESATSSPTLSKKKRVSKYSAKLRDVESDGSAAALQKMFLMRRSL